MHELSIAIALVEQIESIATANKCSQIELVELDVGELRQVIPDLMKFAFIEAARNTVAQDAKLKINFVQAEARCRQCQTKFTPEIDNYICPYCEEADAEVILGNDIILKSIMTASVEQEKVMT